MLIEKYSIGIGDRFGHQGAAQLQALICAKENGVSIVPVWNKSKREHTLIGSSPIDAREEADNAVKELGWKDSYYIDADHIGINTVGDFIGHCNFFTIDVQTLSVSILLKIILGGLLKGHQIIWEYLKYQE